MPGSRYNLDLQDVEEEGDEGSGSDSSHASYSRPRHGPNSAGNVTSLGHTLSSRGLNRHPKSWRTSRVSVRSPNEWGLTARTNNRHPNDTYEKSSNGGTGSFNPQYTVHPSSANLGLSFITEAFRKLASSLAQSQEDNEALSYELDAWRRLHEGMKARCEKAESENAGLVEESRRYTPKTLI